jgi:hypothetical protein
MAEQEHKRQGPTDPRLPDAAGAYPGDEARPGTPGAGEDVCPECHGTGRVRSELCVNCGGSGKIIKGIAGADAGPAASGRSGASSRSAERREDAVADGGVIGAQDLDPDPVERDQQWARRAG